MPEFGDFDYPAPRYPDYLNQPRVTDIDELMPIARHHVGRRYGRSALGGIEKNDSILIMTHSDQDPYVFEAVKRAMLEAGAKSVDHVTRRDLGMSTEYYSAADGWREAVDRHREMTETGVEYSVEAAALKRYLKDRPAYSRIHAGDSGRPHWARATGGNIKGNWLFNDYETFISKCTAYPDELFRLLDLKVLEQFSTAEEVRITDPQGTDISWKVTEEQARLWPKGAYLSGHILGSTIQAVRFGYDVKEFLEQARIFFPTVNGVIAGTSNHTGFFPHIEVEVEGGMIKEIRGGGRYGEVWREIVDRYKDVEYPGFPYKGWAYFNDCSIGTVPKGHRGIEKMWRSTDPTTNLPERMRAGVIHFGFGAEHWDETFLAYARENNLPTMHFPHVHCIFPTFSIKQRGTGEWINLIDKGFMPITKDPDVVRLAETIGATDLLEYDWIPAVPGINYKGDYWKDYAEDSVDWIRRDLAGEFVR
ncbi:hypothetical protein [Nocardioides sp.]|uniref:hypothetical protein n=1 Tax=Nocardioides sp. TaxID=35761 RepID=UPI002607F877|nr:hypothetical protein [Nocardioides sp.]MCW2738317.1 hypothetical protein [Nocardioides sp.]